MGYCVRVVPHKVCVPADKADACLAAVNQLLSDDAPEWVKRERELRCYDYRTKKVINSFFSWLRGPVDLTKGWSSLKEAFYSWRFDSTAENGDVLVGQFLGEKAGDEEVLWRAIAPFVLGGHIDVYGEDGHRWRYVFGNGMVRLFHRNNDVWEKMPFLVDTQGTKELLALRASDNASSDIDADRFQKVEDGLDAETADEKATKAADEVDGKRFRVMLDKEPPAEAPSAPSAPSALLLPAKPQVGVDWGKESPAVVRLMGVRNRGVQ